MFCLTVLQLQELLYVMTELQKQTLTVNEYMYEI